MKQAIEAAYPELEITDDSKPNALVNLLPAVVSEYVRAIPEEVWLMGDSELLATKQVKEFDSLLRHSFWLEYDRAIRSGQKMSLTNIYAAILSKHAFFKEVITSSYRLAYICTPPVDYSVRMEELLSMGLAQYRDILKLPNLDAKGRVDSRLVAVKQKIIEDVTNRSRGKAVENIHIKSQNHNINESRKDDGPKTVEQLEREIRELTGQSSEVLSIPESTGGVSYANEETTQHEVVELHAES